MHCKEHEHNTALAACMGCLTVHANAELAAGLLAIETLCIQRQLSIVMCTFETVVSLAVVLCIAASADAYERSHWVGAVAGQQWQVPLLLRLQPPPPGEAWSGTEASVCQVNSPQQMQQLTQSAECLHSHARHQQVGGEISTLPCTAHPCSSAVVAMWPALLVACCSGTRRTLCPRRCAA